MPRPPSFWEEKRISVVAERAVTVEPDAHRVLTASGASFAYDKLLIASGASPIPLGIPGEELAGIHRYHTLRDAEEILAAKDRVRHAVMIGGGILGLELAHIAVNFGWQTTVLVRGKHVGSPIVDPSGAELVKASLDRQGVTVIFGDQAAEFIGEDSQLKAIRTRAGQTLNAEFAAVCIGVRPEVSFLTDSSILTNGMLLVNEQMATPVSDIYAAGDVATVRTSTGEQVAAFTWSVAGSQARVAAANMAGGGELWHDDVPYNLDALFDLPFAMIGNWSWRHRPGRELHEWMTDKVYRALVTHDGSIESALLLGSRDQDRRLRKLIATKAPIEGNLDKVFE